MTTTAPHAPRVGQSVAFNDGGIVRAGIVTAVHHDDFVMVVHTPSDPIGYGVDFDDDSMWTAIPA